LDDQSTTNLMTQCLEQGIGVVRGERTIVQKVIRAPARHRSSFATEQVRVLLHSGEWIDLFFKNLDPKKQSDVAKIVREESLERSQRELSMYQQILTRIPLSTAQVYGVLWEPDEDLYWMFLEHVGSSRLNGIGDFNMWLEAVRWVAKFHANLRNLSPNEADFLPGVSRQHYSLVTQRVQENFGKLSPDQQCIVTSALEQYQKIIGYLVDLPPRLIHGEYFGKNVMVRSERSDDPITAIDWETASFGPRLVDLASITAGRWTLTQRRIMLQAYAEAYAKESGEDVDMASIRLEMTNVALYRALWWLGYWTRGDDKHISRWIKELQMVMSYRSAAFGESA
jgi:hypothetical protein